MLILSDADFSFPIPENVDAQGLFAIGGDLNPIRLLNAYRLGVFPWYNESEPILWWFPDPRCVLFPQNLKISHSMRKLLKKNEFHFTINQDFAGVIQQCKNIPRKNQDGTWIQPEIIEAYTSLHEMGFAHSAECWFNDELVGGLYGVKLGNVFFGESMFSQKTNASKFAFIRFIQMLQSEGISLIDCQIETAHLRSLGAENISAFAFSQLLKKYIP